MNKLDDIIKKKVAEIDIKYSAPGTAPKKLSKLFRETKISNLPTEDEIREYVRNALKGSPGEFSLIEYAKWIIQRTHERNT